MFVIESKFGLAKKKAVPTQVGTAFFLAAIDLSGFKTLSHREAIDQAAFSIIPIITVIVSSRRCGHAIHLHQLGLEPGQRLALIVE
jgi:hypothetical protein